MRWCNEAWHLGRHLLVDVSQRWGNLDTLFDGEGEAVRLAVILAISICERGAV